MSSLFFDSSALVKRYLLERGSGWTVVLLDPPRGHAIFTASITRVEVAAAIASRHRSGAIAQEERDTLINLLLKHCDVQYQQTAIEAPVLGRAVSLTRSYRLRGYDAVQLAAALTLNDALVGAALPSLTMISADDDLNAAAQAEGLAADTPNAHP